MWLQQEKKNRNDNLQSQLEYRQSPRGVHMSRKRWGQLQARLEIDHPIPPLHPDSCFQWIVAWYSWYLRAVTNRIGSKLHGTEDLVDFPTATAPLDAKVKQALRGARETLHPA